MKSSTLAKLHLFIVLFLPLTAISQNHQIDSLYHILKAKNDDSTKVTALNIISKLLDDKNMYARADSLAHVALAISSKVEFKSGMVNSILSIGSIQEDQGNYAEALKSMTEALKMSDEFNYNTGRGIAYINMGNIYFDQGNNKDALDNFSKAMKISEATGDKKRIGLIYGNIGMVYAEEGNYAQALKNLLQSLKTAQDMGNKEGMATSYEDIGNIYYAQNNYAEALKNEILCLKLAKEIDNKNILDNAYSTIGLIYEGQGNYAEALSSQLMCLKVDGELGNEPGIGADYGNIGIVYADMHNYSKALESQLQSLKIAKEIGNKRGTSNAYGNIGSIFLKQKQYAEAKKYLDSAFVLAKGMGAKDILSDNYSTRAILDSASGDFKDAFADYRSFVTYHDSLNNEDNTKKMVSEQMNYEFERKQADEKAIQDKKDAIAEADKKKQQIVTALVSLGLLLVMLFSALLFSRFKLTQKQKGIIEEQKALVEEKNREVLDSITYAKRLQDAILPPLSVVKKYFPESFVLYKPKDIVAGDFYWMERVGDNILMAACDCTGHGVPGAMVSVVCSGALNRAVKEFHLTEPGKVLDKVRELVLETFEKSESEVQDGMDVSLCCLNTVTNEMQWSGANNPLWYIQSNQLNEIAPDKQPIGKFNLSKPFNTHTLKLQKGDTLYLFTDGYADQFGGPKGKKFKYKPLQEKLLASTLQSMDKQKEILNETIESWQGNLEQVDDILIMGIRIS